MANNKRRSALGDSGRALCDDSVYTLPGVCVCKYLCVRKIGEKSDRRHEEKFEDLTFGRFSSRKIDEFSKAHVDLSDSTILGYCLFFFF